MVINYSFLHSDLTICSDFICTFQHSMVDVTEKKQKQQTLLMALKSKLTWVIRHQECTIKTAHGISHCFSHSISLQLFFSIYCGP